jgi:hypothetical protein
MLYTILALASPAKADDSVFLSQDNGADAVHAFAIQIW